MCQPEELPLDGTLESRYAWARGRDWCFACWVNASEQGQQDWWWLECHEIERRSHARKELVFLRVNLLKLCNRCHADKFATMPHARQLAYGYFNDPERAIGVEEMVAEWLPIRAGRSGPERVTAAEVEAELAKISNLSSGIVGGTKYTTVREKYLKALGK